MATWSSTLSKRQEPLDNTSSESTLSVKNDSVWPYHDSIVFIRVIASRDRILRVSMYLIVEVLVSAFGHQGSSSIESIPSEGVNFTFRLQFGSVSLFCQSQLACVPWSFIHSQIVEEAFADGSVRIECAVVRVIADA